MLLPRFVNASLIPVPRSATAAEKTRRDARIVRDRSRGLRWATVAERNDVSERHARAVWTTFHESAPSVLDEDPSTILRDEVERVDAIVEELADLAAEAQAEAVRLGAVKARLAATQARTQLLQVIGALPADLFDVGIELDVRRLIGVIFQAFDVYGVPLKAKLTILEELEQGGLRSENGGRLPPPGLVGGR